VYAPVADTVAPVDGPVVRASGLRKRYPPGVDALADVSFEVRRGEFVAVLGPSGAGKTTLFRCLTRLTRPDAGSVVLDGREVSSAEGRELRAARHDVALIFQQFNLIRRLTALQNVLVGRLPQVPTWRVLARVFARADRQLAQDAKVILADEPVASLDPEAAAGVLACLRAVASAGVAVVASLHQVHFATTYADRILAPRAGRVVEDAPVAGVDARAIEQIYERNGHGATEPGA